MCMRDEMEVAEHSLRDDGAMSNLLQLQVTKEHSKMDKIIWETLSELRMLQPEKYNPRISS